MAPCYLWWCGVFLVAVLVRGSATTCDQVNQTDEGDVGGQVSLRCTTCPQRESVEWYRLFPDGTERPIPIENPEESSNLVLPVNDSSIGGRMYYCQCPSKPIECHEILVKPHLIIRANPEVVSEGSPLNITCQGEGYPQPQSSDFALDLHLLNGTLIPLPSPNDVENGTQVIIPRAVFPDHGGAYSCYADVNVTEFDPSLPIRNPILHGNARTQVYVYGVKGVINFTAYETLPELSEESNTLAVLECAIYKSPELSVDWTRNGSIIPKNPNDSDFKYVIAEPFQLEGGSTWVYQLTVRRLSRGDVGEYGCTVYFQGEVEGVVPVWILESDLNSVPCLLPTPGAETPRKEESGSCDVYIGSLVAVSILALVLLAVIIIIGVWQKIRSRKVGYSRQQQNTPLGRSMENIPQTPTSEATQSTPPNQYMPAPGSVAEIHGNNEGQNSVSEEHTVEAVVHEDGGGDSQASNHTPRQRLQTDSQNEPSSTTSATSPTSQQSTRDLSLAENKSDSTPPQPQSQADSHSETITQTSLPSEQLARQQSLPGRQSSTSGQDGGASTSLPSEQLVRHLSLPRNKRSASGQGGGASTSLPSEQLVRHLSLPRNKRSASGQGGGASTSLPSEQLVGHLSLPRNKRSTSGQDGGASRKTKSPSSPRTRSPKKKPPPLTMHKDQLLNPASGSPRTKRRKSSTASLLLSDRLLGWRGETDDAELLEPLTPHEHNDSESSS